MESIRRGRIDVSPRLTEELLAYREAPSGALSMREKEVLKLVAEGKSNKEIGEALFISVRTVESHRAHIMSKLSLNSTAEMVKYAIESGYV
jgi:DNA-binding NarL/FixJ family response regulator